VSSVVKSLRFAITRVPFILTRLPLVSRLNKMLKKHVIDRLTSGVRCPSAQRGCVGSAALLAFLLSLNPGPMLFGQAAKQTAPKSPVQAQPAEKPTPEEEESRALEEAVRSSEDNPQALARNLESFLTRFPASRHREQVLRFIYNSALQANDPRTAAESAEKLLDLTPNDPELLSSLVDLLDRQGDAASRAKGLQYATKFVEYAEREAPAPSKAGDDKSGDMPTLMRGLAYQARGKLYAKLGDTDKARADFEKSYALYPSGPLAERLGDLAAEKNDLDQAVREYATAFAFPGADPAEREEIRKKLGKCYVALHQSEKGLGDLTLARYDELVRSLAPRSKGSPEKNADLHDPFAYVLERTDGSPLRLADYRGKVVVMEFWATWCGPCRVEGKLFGRVEEKFRGNPEAVFLAVSVDEDRTGVTAFLKEEKWTTQVAFADGLDHLLAVRGIPTLVIFDRTGRVVFRLEGLDFDSFVETVDKRVREVLARPVQAVSK